MIKERNDKNMEEKLGIHLYEIKKAASFGLIELSKHALTRMSERRIDAFELYEMITNRSTRICQYKAVGKYHNSKPRFVLWCKSNKRVIHVVVEKYGKFIYKVITVYEPSSAIFKDNGRYVKKQQDRNRTKLALHY